MALVTHQIQGSYAQSRSSCKKVIKLTTAFCTFKKIDNNLYFNSVRGSPIHGLKRKSIRISSFEGSERGSHSDNNSIKLSYIAQKNEETLSGNRGSLHIHNLFKSWLPLLPTATENQDRTLEGSPLNKRVEIDQKLMKGGIFKTVWCKFFCMDAKIKIPAIIFIPLFLMVNIKYGAKVTKELTPLWIGGPLLVALYMKMLQVICSLYVFSFKKSVKMVNNFASGKDSIRVHLWQHMVYFRNLDYKDEWKGFQAWAGDTCLDYIESMWSYRKTIGVLKMAKIM